MITEEIHFAKSIKELTPLHAEFPNRLRNIPSCPRTLYVKGDLPSENLPTAAIIGARDATEHGLETARSLASILARNGIAIISGMAYGIDTAAHWGALEGKGKTYAVFGCGLDICYPTSNFRLYEEILRSNGGILSELPLHSPPLGSHFASRNRIIAGLSDLVIVVEAKSRSGTFITVGNALEQGKTIFAVPGRITDRLSEGCNRLIQEGASILTSAQDILEYFHLKGEKEQISPLPSLKNLSAKQKELYSLLDVDSIHIDQLLQKSGFSLSEVLGLLLDLEIQGLCESPKNGYYRRKHI